MKKFIVKSREEEIEILLNDTDDFQNTKKYLSPLIRYAIGLFEINLDQSKELYYLLISDVEQAATNFLASKKSANADYKFSTYFGWYISERINHLGLKRKK